MKKLAAEDLFTLERYARERSAFRARVIAHKANRQLAVGPHLRWCFEDRLTIQYQVQEMLRTERIFEPQGIAEELNAYNPLIPDGSNLKATLLIEYENATERAQRLTELRGFERHCWMRIAQLEPVYAIADEDMERENDVKTSAVHFLRFEFAAPMLAALRNGAALAAGVDHPSYRFSVDPLPPALHATLLADFIPS
jgi:Protein of unknown function (DUF3501)